MGRRVLLRRLQRGEQHLDLKTVRLNGVWQIRNWNSRILELLLEVGFVVGNHPRVFDTKVNAGLKRPLLP